MQNVLKKYSACGAKLIALCPQRQEFNDAISEELSLTFPVIQDRGNQLATAFGLTLATPPAVIEAERSLGLNLPECNDTDHWDLPMPARYVIDQTGAILFASLHADHRQRSEPEACLEIMSCPDA